MKKIITALSFAISLTLMVTLCGCLGDKKSNESKSSSSNGMNIISYAKDGKIPEIPFALGENVETLKSKYKDTVESGSEVDDLTVDEGEKTVWLDGGSVVFCYTKANADKGISVVISKEYAYNFSMGGVSTPEDVIATVDSKDYTRQAATENEVFFLPTVPENCECIKYIAGENELRFIFIDGYLSAVTLINPALWAH